MNSTRLLFRDRFVCAVYNWLLNHVASEWYRSMIGGSVRYGLNAAARDERAKASPPPPFWSYLDEEDLAIMEEDRA